MSFRHLKNVLLRQDNSKTKVKCPEDVLCRLGVITIASCLEYSVLTTEIICICTVRKSRHNNQRVMYS